MSKKFIFKRFPFILALAIFFLIFLYALRTNLTLFPMKSDMKTAKMIIKNQTFTVEIAQSNSQRERGLSYRPNLGKYDGMLFSFESPGLYPFWMKEMKFPLDFIWIKDNQVMDLTESVFAPSSIGGQITVVTPKEPVNAVLEVNSRVIRLLDIKKGDTITIPE